MPSSRVRHLDKAPIQEAVIDFRVELPATTTLEMLKHAVDIAQHSYPKVSSQKRAEFYFDTDLETPTIASGPEQIGFALTSEQLVDSNADAVFRWNVDDQ